MNLVPLFYLFTQPLQLKLSELVRVPKMDISTTNISHTKINIKTSFSTLLKCNELQNKVNPQNFREKTLLVYTEHSLRFIGTRFVYFI